MVGHIICLPDCSELGSLIFKQPVGRVHPPVACLLVLGRVAADEPGVAVDEVGCLQPRQHLLYIGCDDGRVMLIVNSKLSEPERSVVVAPGVLLQDGHYLVSIPAVLMRGNVINPVDRECAVLMKTSS